MVRAIQKQEFAECTTPGHYYWMFNEKGQPTYIHFRCPCQRPDCKRFGVIAVEPAIAGGWRFDGNLACPTITPSIMINPHNPHWHGYLTEGEFEEL
jgi:hypothetical protein